MAEPATRMPGAISPEKIHTTAIPRHNENFSARLLAVPDTASAVADALDELGLGADIDVDTLQPLVPTGRVCGPAVTVRYVPLGGDPSSNRRNGEGTVFGDRDLYGLGRPGDIAVMDCSGSRSGAVMGALSARWAVKAGIAGCIVDGAIRDTASILDTGLPVWSAARRPAAARYRYETVQLNGPVCLGGHQVHPGDYLVADRDGICIIPFFDVPQVVEHCERAHLAETAFIDRIDAAPSVEDLVAGLGSGATPA
ncbi:methyltransferase [Rhodococcus sp. WB1]|uniref:Putative 4-hydroxy-4-methyl-2-oxoglutarate aldolase n=1 Tax=Rhodococcus aetherivorans TaxID=191292 RepID=A0AA46PP67_9NOCA|nr:MULTISPECIES: RraA family protein [Rhodococcus]ANZ27403.1 methyltransferase [Rhodococcus sp. WB1]UYF94312.1 RraA family protein [Rhodococcus aetherivorans]